MNFSGLFEVLLVVHSTPSRRAQEKSVMSITGRVGLWLEERVEVPEGTFNIAVSLHFLKTHFGQHFGELLLRLHERMKVSVVNRQSLRIGVELLELVILPESIDQQ